MTHRSLTPKLALLASLLLICLPLQATPDTPDTPITDQAPELLVSQPQPQPAPLCDAATPSPQDAGWMEIANLAEKRQCTYDEQCTKICPCLPQCVGGYCANCLWCPPTS